MSFEGLLTLREVHVAVSFTSASLRLCFEDMKLRRMRYTGHIIRIEETRNAKNSLIGKKEEAT
jgi:hypothetical protein